MDIRSDSRVLTFAGEPWCQLGELRLISEGESSESGRGAPADIAAAVVVVELFDIRRGLTYGGDQQRG